MVFLDNFKIIISDQDSLFFQNDELLNSCVMAI